MAAIIGLPVLVSCRCDQHSAIESQIESVRCDVDYLTVPTFVSAPLNKSRPPAIPPVPAASLAPQQVAELIAARDRSAKLRRATGVARFDAWMISIFAGLTGLTGLFSIPALLLAGGMAFVGWREFRGAESLRRLDSNCADQAGGQSTRARRHVDRVRDLQNLEASTSAGQYTAMANGDAQLNEMLAPSISSCDC